MLRRTTEYCTNLGFPATDIHRRILKRPTARHARVRIPYYVHGQYDIRQWILKP